MNYCVLINLCRYCRYPLFPISPRLCINLSCKLIKDKAAWAHIPHTWVISLYIKSYISYLLNRCEDGWVVCSQYSRETDHWSVCLQFSNKVSITLLNGLFLCNRGTKYWLGDLCCKSYLRCISDVIPILLFNIATHIALQLPPAYHFIVYASIESLLSFANVQTVILVIMSYVFISNDEVAFLWVHSVFF